MANQTPQQLSAGESAKLVSQVKVRDAFGDKHLAALSFFSPNITQYLTDYFILVDDLKNKIFEESRRCFFDYAFVVFPVHKAYESFLVGVLKFIFSFDVSRKNPIGSYLNHTDEQKAKKLDEMSKRIPWKIKQDEWITRWNSLHDQWEKNRNQLTHPEQEIISSLGKAEVIASSIIREMDVSLKLFTSEFLDPLMELVKKEQEQKREKEKQKLEGFS